MRTSVYMLGVIMITGLLCMPVIGYTQSITEESRKDSISVSASPQYPDPGEEVELSVSSFLVSLAGANINWTINGNVVASGAGQTSINYTMPETGKPANVRLDIIPSGKKIITKKFTLDPVIIDLVWEAKTYTPPFYGGKKLYTGVDTINVTAIPFIPKPGGGQYQPENLIYEWSYNGLNHGSDSGLSENTFPVNVNRNNNSVSVVISNRSGNTVGEASLSVPTVDPRLILYPRQADTGLRLYQPLNSNESTVRQRSSVVAYPYFVPTKTADSNTVDYQWYLNNEPARPTVSGSETGLPEIDGEESINLSVSVESTEFIFPTIETNTSITYK